MIGLLEASIDKRELYVNYFDGKNNFYLQLFLQFQIALLI